MENNRKNEYVSLHSYILCNVSYKLIILLMEVWHVPYVNNRMSKYLDVDVSSVNNVTFSLSLAIKILFILAFVRTNL